VDLAVAEKKKPKLGRRMWSTESEEDQGNH
jgi:hypothetical protein